MYERYYNLKERPFSLSPDPDYLYPSRVHREALESLRYGIESGAGFIVVTGEIGAGKTTLLQAVLRSLDERTIVGRIVNTTLTPRDLLDAIALEFGLDVMGKSKPMVLRDLGQFLVEARAQGRRPVLMIDEAQNLGAQGLEEVRLLSNLETEKSKLLQILVVGQPGLRDLIASPELTQFRQRIAVSYHLAPLDAPATAAYIDFRLTRAAYGNPPRFTPEATALVHQVTGGVPRLINVVCDGTLIVGYADERPQLDATLVREAVIELNECRLLPSDGQAAALQPVAAELPDPVSVPPSPAHDAAVVRAPDHVVSPASAAAEAAAQATRLAQRERNVALREKELAEQRRLLEAEFRALQDQRARASVAARSATTPVSRQSLEGTHSGAPWFDGIRRRFRRAFSEPSHRAVEDN